MLKRNLHLSRMLIVVFSLSIISISVNHATSGNEGIDSTIGYEDNGQCIVKSHITKINIKNNDDISVIESFTINNTNPQHLSYIYLWINQSCSNMTVTDSTGLLNFSKIIESDICCYLKIFLRTEIN